MSFSKLKIIQMDGQKLRLKQDPIIMIQKEYFKERHMRKEKVAKS